MQFNTQNEEYHNFMRIFTSDFSILRVQKKNYADKNGKNLFKNSTHNLG
jgi:hypothetical protein